MLCSTFIHFRLQSSVFSLCSQLQFLSPNLKIIFMLLLHHGSIHSYVVHLWCIPGLVFGVSAQERSTYYALCVLWLSLCCVCFALPVSEALLAHSTVNKACSLPQCCNPGYTTGCVGWRELMPSLIEIDSSLSHKVQVGIMGVAFCWYQGLTRRIATALCSTYEAVAGGTHLLDETWKAGNMTYISQEKLTYHLPGLGCLSALLTDTCRTTACASSCPPGWNTTLETGSWNVHIKISKIWL